MIFMGPSRLWLRWERPSRLMLKILQERGIDITPDEATVMLLGPLRRYGKPHVLLDERGRFHCGGVSGAERGQSQYPLQYDHQGADRRAGLSAE